MPEKSTRALVLSLDDIAAICGGERWATLELRITLDALRRRLESMGYGELDLISFDFRSESCEK